MKPLSELLDSIRDIEGFPIGKDEDILALSEPPYYTACPNPYINDYIKQYGKPYDSEKDGYHRTPFIGDVSEGKNDPIYNAHSYHTKVPHKAIMKYIERYTEEGDIVFDGFCGSGMTGVAAQMLNRRAILSDLSPAATFIAYNYNTPVDVDEFETEAERILEEVGKECGWMYETLHIDGKTKGKINYTVWSDVFICPYCTNEYVFWDAAVDKEQGKVKNSYPCPVCQAELTKRECERATTTFFDKAINQEVTQAKQVPVLINYSVGKNRYKKEPEEFDLKLIKQIEDSSIPYWYPTNRMIEGDESRRNDGLGITHVHHFYTKRNLWVLSTLLFRISKISSFHLRAKVLWAFNSVQQRHGKLNAHRFNVSFPSNITSGTLYIPSMIRENNFFDQLRNKIFRRLLKVVFKKTNNSQVFTGTASTSYTWLRQDSVDYIFTDPPFGDNLMYSELNFLWESWLKVFTNNKTEAIVNKTQGKSLQEYKDLMTACFNEMYRILKPNRWMTVVFHNSKASVWNAIQDAITKAGFVIAQVAVLDKKQGSFKQVTSAGAVKNDLVINAYKPKKEFEYHFLKNAGQNMEKEFIEEHLEHLPPQPNIERTEQMLYSKMLAHYVQRGFAIRLGARQFHKLLDNNFKFIDGYWFLEEQLPEYEEWKKANGLDSIKEIKMGMQTLFVSDEKSALIWLYNFLDEPKTYSEIYTAYNKVVIRIEDEIPELRELLDKNFIFEDKTYRRPRTEKEKEAIEEQREKELDKAFDKLLLEARTSTMRLKNIRKEALKYGFTKAYKEKRYDDILDIAKRLNKKILEENSEINDFVEIAQLKVGEED
ncbi:MAG: DNA methyltransferase [Bacillota bacterium]